MTDEQKELAYLKQPVDILKAFQKEAEELQSKYKKAPEGGEEEPQVEAYHFIVDKIENLIDETLIERQAYARRVADFLLDNDMI